MQEAEAAEQADPPMLCTCSAIVQTFVGYNIELTDRMKTWEADAQVG